MDELYYQAMKRIDNRIEDEMGSTRVRYSVGPLSKRGVPIDNLDRIVRGKFKFYCKNDSFWGEGKDYVSEEVTNPTWMNIVKLADDMIKITGDDIHIFLEGVDVSGNKAYFRMGS